MKRSSIACVLTAFLAPETKAQPQSIQSSRNEVSSAPVNITSGISDKEVTKDNTSSHNFSTAESSIRNTTTGSHR